MSRTYQTGKEYVLYGTLTDPTVSPAQKRRVKAGYRFQGEQHLERQNRQGLRINLLFLYITIAIME